MAIIDPEGLYGGGRLASCSDSARLHWPWLFLAANGFGRMHLDYKAIIRSVYQNFKQPPTEAEFWSYVKEYADHHLLFLYRRGQQVWGQWDCKQGCLPRWQTKRDKESPAPPADQYERWLAEYHSVTTMDPSEELPEFLNVSENFGKLPKTSDDFGELPKASETSGNLASGIGNGVGVGLGLGVRLGSGEEKAPPPPRAPGRPALPDTDEDLEVWFDRELYTPHPKKGHRTQARTLTALIDGIEQAEVRERIAARHRAWCRSDRWTWKSGNAAPYLDEWIADKGYNYDPPPAAKSDEEALWAKI